VELEKEETIQSSTFWNIELQERGRKKSGEKEGAGTENPIEGKCRMKGVKQRVDRAMPVEEVTGLSQDSSRGRKKGGPVRRKRMSRTHRVSKFVRKRRQVYIFETESRERGRPTRIWKDLREGKM